MGTGLGKSSSDWTVVSYKKSSTASGSAVSTEASFDK